MEVEPAMEILPLRPAFADAASDAVSDAASLEAASLPAAVAVPAVSDATASLVKRAYALRKSPND